MTDNPFQIKPLDWKPADYDLPLDTPRPEGWAMISLRGTPGVDPEDDFTWSYLPVFESCPPGDMQHASTACLENDGECLTSWKSDWVILGGTSDTLVR